jgi:hypothetical protein
MMSKAVAPDILVREIVGAELGFTLSEMGISSL